MTAKRSGGPRRRRILDSSRAPASDIPDRLPGMFEDHDLVGRQDDALQQMARSMRQNGTRRRRARAASQLGSQHGELAAWRGRVEAVLDHQRAARKLRNDHHARITSRSTSVP